MATIMAVGNSESTRRCDASCHTARNRKCVCVCGGRYHGKGEQAVELLQNDLLKGWWGEGWQAIAAVGEPYMKVAQEKLPGMEE